VLCCLLFAAVRTIAPRGGQILLLTSYIQTAYLCYCR